MYNLLDATDNTPPVTQDTVTDERNPMSAISPQKEKVRSVLQKNKKGIPLWGRRVLGYSLIVLAIVIFVSYFFVVVPALKTYDQALVVADHVRVIRAYAKDQNLVGIKQQIPQTKASVEKLIKDSSGLVWTKYIPFFGEYYKDFERGTTAGTAGLDAADKMIAVVSPYADLLGLSGTTAQGSTQDRIARLVDTMDKILPEIDSIKPQLAIIKTQMNEIDPGRYGFYPSIQSGLTQGIAAINSAETFLVESKPFLQVLPQFLGRDKPAKYLVIFQNDKELRASGGFVTAYARLTIDKGRVINSESSDIYKIDEKLPIKITPPDSILKYLPEPNGKMKTHLQTRDSNFYPDFKESAQMMEWFFSYVKPMDWDGVIAVDTRVVEGIISVLGSVTVNGVEFSSKIEPKCNCPQVVYELESFAHNSLSGNSERKALIGDLMQEILLQAFRQESKIPSLANEGIRLMNSKHVQLYMHDPALQATVEHLDWAGRIASANNKTKYGYEEGAWDYWNWNESNYAGQKANLYVNQVSDHQYDLAGDGSVIKTVTVTVENKQKNDWWLNGKYRAYFRAYVPHGSELLKAEGSRDQVQSFSQYGKTVFEGFYELTPLQNPPVKITLKYKLPFKFKKDTGMQALFQKQPGTGGFAYKVHGIGDSQNFKLDADLKLTLK